MSLEKYEKYIYQKIVRIFFDKSSSDRVGCIHVGM